MTEIISRSFFLQKNIFFVFEVPAENNASSELQELKNQVTFLTDENRKHKDKFYKQEAERLKIEKEDLEKKLAAVETNQIEGFESFKILFLLL